jgi:hypothetical protein
MEKLSFDLRSKVCVVIMDTGYVGSAEEYIKEFYNKEFDELTTCEAEILVRALEDKKGCLSENNKSS